MSEHQPIDREWTVGGVRLRRAGLEPTPERPATPPPGPVPQGRAEQLPPQVNEGVVWLSGAMIRGELDTPPRREAQLDAGRAAPAHDRYWLPMHVVAPGTPGHADPVAYARSLGLGDVVHTALAPAPPATDELTDHNYDGIQEYDNPTPGWWWLIFHATVVFSVLYVAVFHFSGLVPSLGDRHAAQVARVLDEQFAELNQMPMGEDKLLAIMAEPEWLDHGRSVFIRACALCHGQQGEGLVGPNLTDDVYLNVTDLVGLAAFVQNGSPKGTMPARGGGLLNDNEVALAAAYVASLRSTNLPGPREPEGVPIQPWPTPALAGDGPS